MALVFIPNLNPFVFIVIGDTLFLLSIVTISITFPEAASCCFSVLYTLRSITSKVSLNKKL